MNGRSSNETLVRQCFATASKGDRAGLQEILSADFVIHAPEDHRGVEGLLDMVDTFRSALPDLAVTVDDQFATGDYVASRFTVRGTHDGELLGIPPTGREVAVAGITLSRCEGGKLVEEWELVDVAGLLQQIGALPEPAAA